MTLSNCKQCGTLYIKQSSSKYCGQCVKVHDTYYFKLRDFLRSNPNSTVMEAHEHTGIPLSKLIELRQEDYVPFGK